MSKVNISKSFMIVLTVMAVGFGSVLGLWANYSFTNNLSAPPDRPTTFTEGTGTFDIADIPDVLDVTVVLSGVGAIEQPITATITVTLTDTAQTLSAWKSILYVANAIGHSVEEIHHTGSALSALNPTETWTHEFTPDSAETYTTRIGFWGMVWS